MNLKYIACLLVGLIAGIPAGLLIANGWAGTTATRMVGDATAEVARQSFLLKVIDSGKNAEAASLINGEIDSEIIVISALIDRVPEGKEKDSFSAILKKFASYRAAHPFERGKSPLDSPEDLKEAKEVRRQIDDFLKRYQDSETFRPDQGR